MLNFIVVVGGVVLEGHWHVANLVIGVTVAIGAFVSFNDSQRAKRRAAMYDSLEALAQLVDRWANDYPPAFLVTHKLPDE